MILKMAFRNIRRNSRRSILACLSVGIAIMAVVVLQGLIDGMMDNIIKNSTKNDTGHIRIAAKEYFENLDYMPVYYTINNPDKVMDLVSSIVGEDLVIATGRFRFPVLIEFNGNNKVGICFAGDIQKEKDLIMLHKSIVDGRYLSGKVVEENGIKYREIIIGKKMAEVLGIKVGDSFSLMLQGSDLGIRIPRFRVVGIFSTGLNALDSNIFMISLEDAKDVLGAYDMVQEIIVILKNYNRAKEVADRMNNFFSKNEEFSYLRAVDWKSSGSMAGMLDQVLGIYNIIYFIITLLGAFIIMSIMMMVILERRREIGILKAMGFKKIEILALFTLEGTILGTIGTLGGVIVGVLINVPLSIWGIDFSSSLSNMNFPMDNVIKWMITGSSILGAIVLGVFVSAVISLIPSRHASNMKPIDAIKSV
ncbi:MAG: ABC transporter permease [Brevinematales bacterium]|nr:ABC transporter permease [Brevinematales bacterium]